MQSNPPCLDMDSQCLAGSLSRDLRFSFHSLTPAAWFKGTYLTFDILVHLVVLSGNFDLGGDGGSR